MTDAPPRLATSRCYWGHRWTMWRREEARVSGKVALVQVRECVRCGRYEAETVKA